MDFYTPENPNQFVLPQWSDVLLISHDTVNAKNKNKPKTVKIDLDHAFIAGTLLLVTITFGPNGTVVYIYGKWEQASPKFVISQRELLGQIVMGTSPIGYEPWSGDVLGLAIYSKELTAAEVQRHFKEWSAPPGVAPQDLRPAIACYTFTEGVGREIHNAAASGPNPVVPKNFTVPHKAFLQSPITEFVLTPKGTYLRDVLANLVGFVPLGFLFCAYCACARSRWQAIVYAILAGAILSFSIEVLQAYIPQRFSGMTDVITNTLGTWFGARLASLVLPIRKVGRLSFC